MLSCGVNGRRVENAPMHKSFCYVTVNRSGTWKTAFTGWTDVDLTQRGVEEAKASRRDAQGGRFRLRLRLHFGVEAAIKTLWLALEAMDLMWIPVRHSWRLNERHYGALQGLNKAEMAAKFGRIRSSWRRSYDLPPPALTRATPPSPGRPALRRSL